MYIFLHKESNNMYNKKVNDLLTSIVYFTQMNK